MSQAVVKEREEKSVKLMTIHKSKGLQFPVVFVSGINKRPNVTDTYKDFIFDLNKGLGALICDYDKGIRANTAAHRLLEEDYKDKLLGESMRLFYVALTRAEEKLIITAYQQVQKNRKRQSRGRRGLRQPRTPRQLLCLYAEQNSLHGRRIEDAKNIHL